MAKSVRSINKNITDLCSEMHSLKRHLDERDHSSSKPLHKQAHIDINMSGNKSESSDRDDIDELLTKNMNENQESASETDLLEDILAFSPNSEETGGKHGGDFGSCLLATSAVFEYCGA